MNTQIQQEIVSQLLRRSSLHRAVATQSGLPVEMLLPETSNVLVDSMVRHLQSRLFGQDSSLAKLGNVLKAKVAERFIGWEEAIRTLRPTWDRRPVASFLAVGPTGVGKTETAKLLAEVFFQGRIIVLNGSEIGPDAPHGTSTWTGSPPGYVGSDRGGVLTNGLRMYHSGVILIDELEKADRTAIQNIIIPLLGEGTITDKNNGETLFATDFVVFCTSNLRVQTQRLNSIGFNTDRSAEEPSNQDLFDALSPHLLPEVLGRFNGILGYQELTLETQWRVWSLLRHELAAKLGHGSRIVLSEEAKRLVQRRFARIETGARGIRDLFLEQVVPLAVGAKPGSTLKIGVDDERLALEREGGPGTIQAAPTPTQDTEQGR